MLARSWTLPSKSCQLGWIPKTALVRGDRVRGLASLPSLPSALVLWPGGWAEPKAFGLWGRRAAVRHELVLSLKCPLPSKGWGHRRSLVACPSSSCRPARLSLLALAGGRTPPAPTAPRMAPSIDTEHSLALAVPGGAVRGTAGRGGCGPEVRSIANGSCVSLAKPHLSRRLRSSLCTPRGCGRQREKSDKDDGRGAAADTRPAQAAGEGSLSLQPAVMGKGAWKEHGHPPRRLMQTCKGPSRRPLASASALPVLCTHRVHAHKDWPWAHGRAVCDGNRGRVTPDPRIRAHTPHSHAGARQCRSALSAQRWGNTSSVCARGSRVSQQAAAVRPA